MKKFIISIITLLLLGSSIQSQSDSKVTLAWNHSPDTNVIGYNIYRGTSSGVYVNTDTVGYTNVATISGLIPGSIYYFAATAFNAAGVESIPSNEISYTTGVVVSTNIPSPPENFRILIVE